MYHDRNKPRRMFDRSATIVDNFPQKKMRQVQRLNTRRIRRIKNAQASSFQQDE